MPPLADVKYQRGGHVQQTGGDHRLHDADQRGSNHVRQQSGGQSQVVRIIYGPTTSGSPLATRRGLVRAQRFQKHCDVQQEESVGHHEHCDE